MSKDYLDKWEERQIKNTEIIEKQQAKAKMKKEINIKIRNIGRKCLSLIK